MVVCFGPKYVEKGEEDDPQPLNLLGIFTN
jgi:hypothetical protein